MVETTKEYFELHDMDELYRNIGYFEEVVVKHL